MIRALTLIGAAAIGVALAPAVAADPAPDGATIFAENCAACHQADGKGIPGAFPALAANRFATGDPRPIALTLLNGRGGMPPFAESLSDDQLAAAISYVRKSWGNKAAPVPAGLFAAARTGGKDVLARPIPAH